MTKAYGDLIEDLALEWYLRERGGRLVCRNYRCRVGEVDLIFEHEDRWVFVEVRARRHGMQTALESVSPRKLRRLGLTIRRFLAERRLSKEVQLDILGWDGRSFSHFPNIWLYETN